MTPRTSPRPVPGSHQPRPASAALLMVDAARKRDDAMREQCVWLLLGVALSRLISMHTDPAPFSLSLKNTGHAVGRLLSTVCAFARAIAVAWLRLTSSCESRLHLRAPFCLKDSLHGFCSMGLPVMKCFRNHVWKRLFTSVTVGPTFDVEFESDSVLEDSHPLSCFYGLQ